MSTDASYSDIVKLIRDCQKLVDQYKWLVDAFVIDFFAENAWQRKVPASWRHCNFLQL
jgi:arabinogalactan endo-1,4-beta-galactosidase